jgi:flagellar protein FlgJ
MVMKSMREATPQEGMFDSEQSKTFTSMLDQQLTQNLAKRGVGLADMMIKQMSRSMGAMPESSAPGRSEQLAALAEAAQAAGAVLPNARTPDAGASLGGIDAIASAARSRPRAAHVEAFQAKLSGYAEQASRETGIPAKFMLGQAALESGWGKRQITGADGTPSNNLFGMKATPGWKGRTVEAVTTEYVNGVPTTRREKFRAYDSPAESFADYARMLRTNPRYEQVLAGSRDAAGFAHGLQRAGYATDPMYAAKLTRIINHHLS